MSNYRGVIIEESLEDKMVLDSVKILSTEKEKVTKEHHTPWLGQWTLHNIEIAENNAEVIAAKLSIALDPQHPWYADYKNDTLHYIIFRNKVFRIDRQNKEQYDEAKAYGLALGIPAHQVDFHPDVKQWER